jgi:hypothetical protein
LLVDLELAQAQLLEKVCSRPTISGEDLRVAGTLETSSKPKRPSRKPVGTSLF